MSEVPNRNHYGRAWEGTLLEDMCPCDKAPCGLATNITMEGCPEHSPSAAKTMRQAHTPENCPKETAYEKAISDLLSTGKTKIGDVAIDYTGENEA